MNTNNIIVIIVQIAALYIGLMTVFFLYKYFTTGDIVKAHYKRRLRLHGILLIIGAVIFVLIAKISSSMLGTARMSSGPNFNTSYTGQSGLSSLMPQRNTPGSIADTREFLKKSFSGRIETRKVESVAKKVELLIKGSDGRIDTSNVEDTSAYFAFVIPKSELDNFEEEMRSYAHPKLYTQTISTQNLLTDKQNLERQQTQNTQTITALTDEQKKVQSAYQKQSATLTTQITAQEKQLALVQTRLAQTTDEDEHESLLAQERTLVNQINNLKNNLASATTTFKNQMANLGLSLADQAVVFKSLEIQEDDFFDNIETVQGSVYINHISLWQLATKLSPIHPIIVLAIIFVFFKIISLTKGDKKLAVSPSAI